MVEAGAYEGVGFFALAVYLFLGVSILCDAHLCPALDKLCDYLKIPTSLAAATLVSFGSSAPELIISTLGCMNNQTELSIPAILVSALIAFAAIPPLVVWAAGPITLDVRSVVRDALGYIVVLVLFISFSRRPEIGAVPASILVASYFIYLGVVFVTSTSLPQCDTPDAAAEIGSNESSKSGSSRICTCFGFGSGASTNEKLKESLLESVEAAEGGAEASEDETGPLMSALQLPFEKLFGFTIPDGAVMAFVMSMVWLCVLSYAAMVCANSIASSWNLSTSTAGITLLAWGGQLPDTIAAIALAKNGKPDEAITQAISSQVINVSIGLGLPLLAYSCLMGKPTRTEDHNTIRLLAMLVLASIVAYLLTMAPGMKTLREGRWSDAMNNATISRLRAGLLAATFLALYVTCIIVSEFTHRPATAVPLDQNM